MNVFVVFFAVILVIMGVFSIASYHTMTSESSFLGTLMILFGMLILFYYVYLEKETKELSE